MPAPLTTTLLWIATLAVVTEIWVVALAFTAVALINEGLVVYYGGKDA